MKDVRKYINHVVNQHKEPVDNDALWAGIQKKMDKPKKRRPIFPLFIWGISILIITLGGINLYNLSGNSISDKNNTNFESVTNVNEDNTSINLPSSDLKTSTNTINKLKKNKVSLKNKVSQEESKELSRKKELKLNSTKQTYAETLTIKSQMPKDNANYPLDQKKNNNRLITTISPSSILKGNFIGKAHIEIAAIQSRISEFTYERSDIGIKPEIEIMLPLSSKKEKHSSILNSITFYTQYGTGSKSIQPDSTNSERRNNSEELMEQFRFGIESDLINLHDFTFYGGISYAAINNKVRSDETYYENMDIFYLKSISILEDGSKIENFVTEELPHLVNKRSVRYNTNKLISMPFGIRYSKSILNLKLSFGLGLDLNYGLANEHEVVGTDGRLTNIPIDAKLYTPSFHSTLTLEYPIFDKLYLHSKIMFRSISLEQRSSFGSWEEKYKLYGFDLGLKVEF